MAEIHVEGVTKSFPGVVALNRASIQVEKGEFYTLLGPSGCGKTTLLRTIAGFYQQDEGHIYIGEKLIDNVPVHKRNIAMVFQNYAVFPHMTVSNNVAYGLRAKKIPKREIKNRVSRALDLVRLTGLGDRIPSQLSGGQQQRVALARSVVIEPRVLLMDEPLSNLDAKLRVEMRSEIKGLQRNLKITTIYVTHDQEEALALSDRIAVMKEGDVVQIGIPQDLYQNPLHEFVADFLGTTNFLDGLVTSDEDKDGLREVKVGNEVMRLPLKGMKRGRKVRLSLRPEEISMSPTKGEDEERLYLKGHIREITFLGPLVNYKVEVPPTLIKIVRYEAIDSKAFALNSEVYLNFPLKSLKIFDAESGERIELDF